MGLMVVCKAQGPRRAHVQASRVRSVLDGEPILEGFIEA